ncbi:hypothetical protein ABZ372_52265 [Streptomyces sp. NPDC005921]
MSGNTRSSAPSSATDSAAQTTPTEDYWRERFAAPAPETSLPLDFPYPAHPLEPRPRATRTAALAASADEATLLAAFVALLHRYGGGTAQDLTVAHDGLPLRLSVAGGMPFAEVRERILATRAEAAAHRLPTAELLRLLAPEPGRGGGLLCATGFGTAPWDGGGPLDLALSVTDGRLRADYAADLFEAATVDRILGHCATLLADALARPGTPLADLELLGEEERERILRDWNDTGHDVPVRTWPRMFADQVAARPDEVALIHEDVRLTYAELDARASRLAHALVGRTSCR